MVGEQWENPSTSGMEQSPEDSNGITCRDTAIGCCGCNVYFKLRVWEMELEGEQVLTYEGSYAIQKTRNIIMKAVKESMQWK